MDRWLAFSLWILSRETEWLFAWFFTHYCHLWILQQQTMFLKPHFLSFPIFLFFFLYSPSFFHDFVFSIFPLILFIQFLQIYDLVTASFSSPPSRLVFSCYPWFTQWLTSPALLLHYFFPFLSALILCDLTKNLYSRPHFYVLPASPSFSSFPINRASGPLPETVVVEGNKLTVRKVDDAVNTTFICEVKNRLGSSRNQITTVVIGESINTVTTHTQTSTHALYMCGRLHKWNGNPCIFTSQYDEYTLVTQLNTPSHPAGIQQTACDHCLHTHTLTYTHTHCEPC